MSEEDLDDYITFTSSAINLIALIGVDDDEDESDDLFAILTGIFEFLDEGEYSLIFVEASSVENYEELIFTLSNDTQITFNYTELFENGFTYQTILSQIQEVNEFAELRDFFMILAEGYRFAESVAANSVFGFDHIGWEQYKSSHGVTNPALTRIINGVEEETIYHRSISDGRFDYFSRLNADHMAVGYVLARYYELNEKNYNSFDLPSFIGLTDLMMSILRSNSANSVEFSSADYGHFKDILEKLLGYGDAEYSLSDYEYLLNRLDNLNQNLFYQYVMSNPLTPWNVNSANDLRAFISMMTRGILNTTVTLNLDPQNFGIQFLGEYKPTGGTGTKAENFFTTDWRQGGSFGLSTTRPYEMPSNVDTNIPVWSDDFQNINYYFGTTNINPGTYPVSDGSITSYSFIVNYGQVFPLPTEVNFRGVLLGANIITGQGLIVNSLPVMLTVTDAGINHLDYLVYGTSGRTFRLNNFFVNSYAPNNVPNCVNRGSTLIDLDDIIGVPHGGQNYYRLACTRVSGQDAVTAFTNTAIPVPQELLTNLRNVTTPKNPDPEEFNHHSFTWPEDRQYITYNRVYPNPYVSGGTTDINVSAHWVEVFKVEFYVAGDLIWTEYVDISGTSIYPKDVTDSAILALLLEKGLEFEDEDTAQWQFNSNSSLWTPGSIITSNVSISAVTTRPIVYNITYQGITGVGIDQEDATLSFDLVTYTAVSGSALLLPTPTAITGYSFVGWVTDAALTSGSIDIQDFVVTELANGTVGNLTLYAIWAIIESNIAQIVVTDVSPVPSPVYSVSGVTINIEDEIEYSTIVEITVAGIPSGSAIVITVSGVTSQLVITSTSITTTNEDSFTFSFTMPAENVTISYDIKKP
jgi:uncharacterized repeat protein (TIGR02543 family)